MLAICASRSSSEGMTLPGSMMLSVSTFRTGRISAASVTFAPVLTDRRSTAFTSPSCA